MAKNCFKPGEEHRERVVEIFLFLIEQKTDTIKRISRAEMESAIRDNPGYYRELNVLTDAYLRTVITRILNTDSRVSPDPEWRRVWGLRS